MTSRWRLAVRRAIQKAVLALPAHATKSELKEAIDQAYPFGSRKNYPYQVWLDERRKAFYDLGILRKQPDKLGRRTKKPGVKHDYVSPGQLSLFDF